MQSKILTSDIKVEILPGLPANDNVHQFTFEGRRTYSEGFVIRVISEKYGEWIGNYQPASPSTNFYGIFSYPLKNHICVVADGRAYIVNVKIPDQYQVMRFGAIYNVLERENVLIFVTHTHMHAYGENGLFWKTKKLSLDGINIGRIEQNFIIATAYSPRTSFLYQFKLDLVTGKVVESNEKDSE